MPKPTAGKAGPGKEQTMGAEGSQGPWVQMVRVVFVQLPGTDSREPLHLGNRCMCACLLTPLHLNTHAYVYMCSDCVHMCVCRC